MRYKNDEVAPLARLLQESFNTDKAAIRLFDSTLDVTFVEAWVEKTIEVEGIELPEVITRLMKGQKQIWEDKMTDTTPFLKVLGIRINTCITNATISQTLASFMIDKVNVAINDLSTTKYNTAFSSMIAEINKDSGANAAALNTAGFTTLMLNNLVALHTDIMTARNSYTAFKVSRKNLSPANKALIQDLYDVSARVCVSGVGTFSMPLITSKLDQYIMEKAITAVRPTPPKEERDRHIGATKSICLKTNPVKKDTLQLTLKTKDTGPVYFCMQDLKTGVCTSGGTLVYGVTTSIKQKDITGTGKHLIITNPNLVNVTVGVFTIKG